ncbi:MAG: YigZ family protein [Gammaproteobacteria bacterium]
MTDRFDVPGAPASCELHIKRSRFVTAVDYVADRADFMRFLERRRQALPDARHHCWAFVAGPPGDLRFADKNDDGEPRGTAGKPILNVLAHASLGHVGAVVTRYFGGIKLGAGGLVRAYSQCVVEALERLERRTQFVTEQWTVRLPYTLHASVQHALTPTEVILRDTRFDDAVTLVLDVPLGQVDQLGAMLDSLGQGAIDRAVTPDALPGDL